MEGVRSHMEVSVAGAIEPRCGGGRWGEATHRAKEARLKPYTLFPVLQKRNQSSEKFHNFLKVTKLGGSRTGEVKLRQPGFKAKALNHRYPQPQV